MKRLLWPGLLLPLACNSSPPPHALCAAPAAALTRASLSLSTPLVPGFTLPPLESGQRAPVAVSIINNGTVRASQMSLSLFGDAVAAEDSTCGDALEPGATCTVGVDVLGTGSGKAYLIDGYYDGTQGRDTAIDLSVNVLTQPFVPGARPLAALPPMPSHGGTVITQPRLVTVAFSDTPEDDRISAFGDWLFTSGWFQAVGGAYGIAAGTHQHVRLTEPSPTTYLGDDFDGFVGSRVGTELPSQAGQPTLYVFFLAPGTTQIDERYQGWHRWTRNGGGPVYYAVITPSCAGASFDQWGSLIASHEIAEMLTDPDGTGLRFDQVEGEVGDLCNGNYAEGDFALKTIWSNAHAAQGVNPCVPALDGGDFDVAGLPAGGVTVAPGSSVVLPVTGWSANLVGDWRVVALGTLDGGSAPVLQWDSDLVNDGRTVNLTVSAPAGASPASETVWVYSRDRAGHVGGVKALPVTVSACTAPACGSN